MYGLWEFMSFLLVLSIFYELFVAVVLVISMHYFCNE